MSMGIPVNKGSLGTMGGDFSAIIFVLKKAV